MSTKKIKKFTWKKVGQILYGLVFSILVLIAGIVIVSSFKLPGNYKFFVIQSGSMEPVLKRMGIILVKPQTDYQKGDIITAMEPANLKVSLTHRIFEVVNENGKIFYITKGDANKDADTEKRPQENVVGRVLFTIPYIGYPVSFAKTKEGLIILIVIPATLIVYSELITVKNEVKKLIQKRKERKLTFTEKVELKLDQEEIKAQNWLKKLFKKIFKRKKK